MTIQILQLIGEFTSGGAEAVAINLANHIDKNTFSMIMHARYDGPLAANLAPEVTKKIIKKNRTLDVLYLKKLVTLIKKHNVAIIHSHLFGNNLYGFFAAKLTGKKIIQTIHGIDCIASMKRTFLYNCMSPFVDKVVFVSPILRDEFLKKVTTLKNYSVILNGITIDEHVVNTSSDQLKNTFINQKVNGDHFIGAIGNIKYVKGYDVLIRAAKTVILKYPKTKFIIFGEAFEKDLTVKNNLDDLINTLGLQNSIHFMGFRNDAKNFLPLLDIYVLPSRSEGLSMALLEAMAARRAVVASNVGGNQILIENGMSGVLIPPEDPSALSNAIMDLLCNEQKRLELGKEARKKVETTFSVTAMTKHYEQLYSSVLNLH